MDDLKEQLRLARENTSHLVCVFNNFLLFLLWWWLWSEKKFYFSLSFLFLFLQENQSEKQTILDVNGQNGFLLEKDGVCYSFLSYF